MIDSLWAVMIDGPDTEDIYLPATCMSDAVSRASEINEMFRAFHLTQFAMVVRWPDSPEDHTRLLRDGVPGWD